MKASIVTATYNAAQHLPRLIASLRAQTNKNFEWVVADGGSTDGTLELLHKIDDLNLIIDSRPDFGVYDAFNRALDIVSGDYLLFLGADDRLVVDLNSINVYLVNSSTIYYGDVYMPHRHCLFGGKYSKFRITCQNICHQAIFYPRSVFDKYKYNLKYTISADYDVNLRCFSDPFFSFRYIPMLIAVYSDGAGRLSSQEDDRFFSDRYEFVRKNFSFIIFLYYIFRLRLAYFLKKVLSLNIIARI